MPKKLLEGVRVADFTWAAVGPQTTRALAIYGAEVIKIESKTRPDFWRTRGPFKDNIPGFDRGIPFADFNASKLSLGLNLAHPKGVEVAKRLIARSDIVVDNFAGGSMQRMGLGYEELRKVKPDIIMLSACMQGQTGPHHSHPGFGNQLTALVGFSHIAGWPDREPTDLGAYTDRIAPLFNILAVLAALDYRRRTGKGQYLDLSEYENGVHFLAPFILDYAVNGHIATRMGNRSLYAVPHNLYRCRGEDRWCAIAVFTDEEWQSFSRVIGNPAWTEDTRFRTLVGRKENEEELDRLVEAWTIEHSADEVMTMMQAAGVSAGVRRTDEELLRNDAQVKHRHFYQEIEHPVIGRYHVRGPLFRLSKAPYELRSSPLIGQHSEYVLKEILGLSDDEIAELAIEGVLE